MLELSSDDEIQVNSCLKDFIVHSNMIGNVIAAAALQKGTFEPLPFLNYGLFKDNYTKDVLKINVNPHASEKHVFEPNTPIKVKVTAERKHGAHIFHPYFYTLRFSHGDHKWEVTRLYKEIKETHKTLLKLVRETIHPVLDLSMQPDWPLFPTDYDHLITPSQIADRCQKLGDYLERLLTYAPYRDHPAVLDLLGVSHLSFVKGLGPSMIEGRLQKRGGDNVYFGSISPVKLYCDKVKFYYFQRRFIVKDSYIVYTIPENNDSVGFPMLVDNKFECRMKIRAGAYHALVIKNSQRSLVLKCKSYSQQREWYDKIMFMLHSPAARVFHESRYLANDSFAPFRQGQMARWFINGGEYFENVMLALNNAREEIFIGAWWLSPELFLKRPTYDLQYRLDQILLKKANEGVKIYILLFKEVSISLYLASLHAKSVFTQKGRNPNIKVLRHPEHSPNGNRKLFWSHHEKIVVIDQSVGFVGGIDLCLGRWDDDLHRLVDLGRKENKTTIEPTKTSHSEINFELANDMMRKTHSQLGPNRNEPNNSNHINPTLYKTKTLTQKETSFQQRPDAPIMAALMGNSVGKFNRSAKKIHSCCHLSAPIKLIRSSVSESSTLSKTTHTAETMSTQSSASNKKLANLFDRLKDFQPIKQFNHQQNDKERGLQGFYQRAKSNWSMPKFDFKSHNDLDKRETLEEKWTRFKKKFAKVDGSVESMSSNDSADQESDVYEKEESIEPPVISDEGYYWIGKDYCNTFKADFRNVADYTKDLFDRNETPRMPWRDHGMMVIGESARDLGRHFIQRWNQCKREKVKSSNSYPFLLPKSYSEPYDYSWFNDKLYKCEVQITRSIGKWSGGISEPEISILNAHCELIKNAEHYIYIENQYFVTTTNPAKDREIKNPIGREIVNRIVRAHKEGKKFRVYVVQPLLPAFESMNAIQAIEFYNIRSIVKGKYSVYRTLKREGISDPSEYITFHGMRNWSVLMGKLVQEIVYVHSKIMIVDDKWVINGSANLNDRSMMGTRDSEVAAVVKDQELFEATLNGQQVMVGKFASSLRKKLFKLHLGIYFNNPDKIDVQDCVSDEFYNLFRSISSQNTAVFDQVFKCLPSDNVRTFSDMVSYSGMPCLSKTDPFKGKQALEANVKGFIVDLPLKFLSKEKSLYLELNKLLITDILSKIIK